MKKIGVLFSFIAMISFVLPVIGCQHSSSGSDDWPEDAEAISEKKQNSTNASVVSRWVNSTEGNVYEVITLYDDGTYTYEKYKDNELAGGQKGTYSSENNDETKLTVTQEWLEGNWSNASGFGFYIKISGNTIEVVIWWTKEDSTEGKCEESSSFTLDEESGGGSSFGSGGSNTGSDNGGNTGGTGDSGNTGAEYGENTSEENENEKSYFTVAEAAEYISSLTEKGTYYVKVVDYEETSSEALKTAFQGKTKTTNTDQGIYVELDLSESVVEIGRNALCGKANYLPNYCLVSIVLPNNCTEIGYCAFMDCASLVSIEIPDITCITSIGENAFYRCLSLVSFYIPETVTSLGNFAFCNCTSLTSVYVPKSITCIGGQVFDQCSSLKDVSLPSTLKTIDVLAFEYCSGLEEITIPASVTYIGESAFYGCDSLKSVVFEDPNNWTIKNSVGTIVVSDRYDLSDPEIAATILTGTSSKSTDNSYVNYDWYK